MSQAEALECASAGALVDAVLEGDATAAAVLFAHTEVCLSCRATLAGYRRLVRLLADLRVEQVQLPPGLLADVLAAVGDAAERQVLAAARFSRHWRAAVTVLGATTGVGAFVIVARTLRRRPS